MYYKKCELCGVNLEHGEDCRCELERRLNKQIRSRYYNNIFEYIKELEDFENERITV